MPIPDRTDSFAAFAIDANILLLQPLPAVRHPVKLSQFTKCHPQIRPSLNRSSFHPGWITTMSEGHIFSELKITLSWVGHDARSVIH
jgi:hypothetical protein